MSEFDKICLYCPMQCRPESKSCPLRQAKRQHIRNLEYGRRSTPERAVEAMISILGDNARPFLRN